MNKMLRFVAMAAAVVSFSLPTWNSAEAANVALLPLINNVVEREDLGSIYYDRAVDVAKMSNNDLVDDSTLDKAIAKYTKAGVIPTKEDMMSIASEGNVDVVYIMQIDELNRKDLLDRNTTDYQVQFDVVGKSAYYNAMTGVYKVDKVRETKIEDAGVTARYDIAGEMFGNNVTRYVRRALGFKKIVIEKPRISRAGLKGNAR